MGITKTEQYTSEQIEISVLLKAIAHPARIAILEYLLQTEKCICGDIVQELPLSQSTVSQHLKELKNADLIQGEISGNAICYCVNFKTMQKIEQYFSDKIKSIQLKCKQC